MLKRSLLAATALCTAAACSRDVATENEPAPGEIVEESAETIEDGAARAGEEISAAASEAADATGDFIENELSQSNARGFTVRNIIGESVRGSDGAALAVIDDLLFSDAGLLRAVVLKDGAFLGLGGEPATLAADRFAIVTAGSGEISVTAQMGDGELKQMTESLAYNPTGGLLEQSGNLLSMDELIGRTVVNVNGDKVADVFDVILAPPGRFETIILSTGGLGALGNRLIAMDLEAVDIDPDTGVIAVRSAPDFNTLPTFEY